MSTSASSAPSPFTSLIAELDRAIGLAEGSEGAGPILEALRRARGIIEPMQRIEQAPMTCGNATSMFVRAMQRVYSMTPSPVLGGIGLVSLPPPDEWARERAMQRGLDVPYMLACASVEMLGKHAVHVQRMELEKRAPRPGETSPPKEHVEVRLHFNGYQQLRDLKGRILGHSLPGVPWAEAVWS